MRYGTNTSNPLAVQQQQIVAQQRAAAQQLVLQQQQQQQQAVHQQSMAPVIASNVQPVAQSVARQQTVPRRAPPSPQISVVPQNPSGAQRQPPVQQTATPTPPIVSRPTVQEQPKPTRPPMPNTVRRQPAPQKQSGHQILKDLNPTLYDSLVPIVKPKSQLSKAQKRRLRAQRQKNGGSISDTPKTHTAQTLKIEAAPSVAASIISVSALSSSHSFETPSYSPALEWNGKSVPKVTKLSKAQKRRMRARKREQAIADSISSEAVTVRSETPLTTPMQAPIISSAQLTDSKPKRKSRTKRNKKAVVVAEPKKRSRSKRGNQSRLVLPPLEPLAPQLSTVHESTESMPSKSQKRRLRAQKRKIQGPTRPPMTSANQLSKAQKRRLRRKNQKN